MPDPDSPAAPVPSPDRTRKRRVLRRLRAFLAVIVVLIAGGAGLIGMALRERKPSLLAQAIRVMDMQNCQEYAWKSDHEIIQYNYYPAGVGYVVYDTNMHRNTPVVMLKKHMPNFRGGMSAGPRRFLYPKPDLVRMEIWDQTPKDYSNYPPFTQMPPDHVVYLRKNKDITQVDVNCGGSNSEISPHNDLVVWWFPRKQQAPGWAALLHRFLPTLQTGSWEVADVYVSRTDGSAHGAD